MLGFLGGRKNQQQQQKQPHKRIKMYTNIIIGFSVILCLCSLSQCNDIINNGYVCCFLWNLIIVKNIIIKQNSWNRLLYSFIFKIGFFFVYSSTCVFFGSFYGDSFSRTLLFRLEFYEGYWNAVWKMGNVLIKITIFYILWGIWNKFCDLALSNV